MTNFNVPEWALSNRATDPFKIIFKGGNHHGNTAAKLAACDHIIVSRCETSLPPNHSANVLSIDHSSVAIGHAAFVRHKKNGHVYCIDLASHTGTFLNSSRCPEHKPVKVEVGSIIQFGGCEQQFVLTGPESVAAKAHQPKAHVLGDKENMAPQGLTVNKVPQQQQQQQQHPSKSFSSSSLLSSLQIQRNREAEAKSLRALLPPTCCRDNAVTRKLQLPKHMLLILQVNASGQIFYCRFSVLVDDAMAGAPSGGREMDVEQRARPVAFETRMPIKLQRQRQSRATRHCRRHATGCRMVLLLQRAKRRYTMQRSSLTRVCQAFTNAKVTRCRQAASLQTTWCSSSSFSSSAFSSSSSPSSSFTKQM
jgi:hypothetical protein